MSRAIEEMIKQDKLEKDIKRGIDIITAGLYEESDVENIDESYLSVETDVKTKGYEVYLKDDKVVFAKSLNVENNFGKKIFIPDVLSDDEYQFLVSRNVKKTSNKFFLIMGYFFMCFITLGIILNLVDLIKRGSDFTNISYSLSFFFFPSLILSLLLIAKSREKK